MTDFDPSEQIAAELKLSVTSVRAVVRLLTEGGSVPFIARYRKEQTGGLDEVAIRAIEEKREYFTEVFQRRLVILKEIETQGKLTPTLRAALEACWNKSALEDLYLPFRPKRRTRAMIAKERGLEPLARKIVAGEGAPERDAAAFVDATKDVPDEASALAGARDIVAEQVAEHSGVRARVRQVLQQEGVLATSVAKGVKGPTKFEMYYDHSEKLAAMPSHRFLAVERGEAEKVLRTHVRVDEARLVSQVTAHVVAKPQTPYGKQHQIAVDDACKRLLLPSLETDVRSEVKERADREAVAIFGENLRKLLLAAPLGRRVVLGIDPGQRSGCKCVVVDDTGKVVEHTLINLVAGPSAQAHAAEVVLRLCRTHKVFAIAVGNGTHGRETFDFCRATLKAGGLEATSVVSVSESGASVYSASDIAREEFPDLDLTVRGAISIARRLQDPLAELVKVDPKAIGVGQYQHDVSQTLLQRKLDEVVESCVNSVGVELNTASAPLLARVAGIGPTLAKRIVADREKNGAFPDRASLKRVSGLGPKTFEQAAGFIRVRGSQHALDASAVHPERYALVGRIAKDLKVSLQDLIGNEAAVKAIRWQDYVSDEVGMPTLRDIESELQKPGRDPRSAFEAVTFRDDIRTLEDLKPEMALEGVVTNVVAFGAFVDIGVHQDGLVHISQLSDAYVSDPHKVVRVGDRIKVRVVEVDLERKRIALTAKTSGSAANRGSTRAAPFTPAKERKPATREETKAAPAFANNAFASLAQRNVKQGTTNKPRTPGG
jgi:uncharacterized protein